MLKVNPSDEGIATLISYFTTAWLGSPQGFDESVFIKQNKLLQFLHISNGLWYWFFFFVLFWNKITPKESLGAQVNTDVFASLARKINK